MELEAYDTMKLLKNQHLSEQMEMMAHYRDEI
ncbi:hypothetical protein X798_04966 [Onchocerca flexuosa]|uniref:Uncharacterized protein n=1 Tax=Onchocerca flexuosa TaxID=387005 RepID=A0A238BTG0_9BILA|nr:hypothetical protein X798_04966 [Onchocerca flexuosa]